MYFVTCCLKEVIVDMPFSKGFFLVLFLATVSCIIVLQMSLDDWILNTSGIFAIEQKKGSSTANGLNPNKKNVDPAEGMLEGKKQVPQKSLSIIKKEFTKYEGISKTLHGLHTNAYLGNARTTKKAKLLSKTKGQTLPIQSNYHYYPFGAQISKHQQIQLARLHLKENAIKNIKKMPYINPENVTRVFLLTYFRSGSSFLGELLQQHWKTFYQFEPLHFMSVDERVHRSQEQEAFDVLRNIYHCNFQNLTSYLDWIKLPKNRFLFRWSRFLMLTCRGKTELCFAPDFVTAVCERAPVQIIKGVRVHMEQLNSFLSQNKELNIKVIYLTRDPRGILSSRWNLGWCQTAICSNPNVLCKEMEQDFNMFEQLRHKEPHKFIHVQYENLAQNPSKEAARIFKFLSLPFSQSVKNFLKSHTTAKQMENVNPYTTRRNSSAIAFSWKQRLEYNQVLKIQESCSSVIRSLNHILIHSPLQLDNKKLLNEPPTLSKRQSGILNHQIFVNELDLVYMNKSSNVLFKSQLLSGNNNVSFNHTF